MSRIVKGTTIVADEATSWNPLHSRIMVQRIDHSRGYSLGGIYTNGAEGYESRARRGERGIYHHVAGAYLDRYAAEWAWREDYRRVGNGDQVKRTIALALASGRSEVLWVLAASQGREMNR